MEVIVFKKYGGHCDDSIKAEMGIIVINNSVYKYVYQSPSEIFIKTWTLVYPKFYSIVIECIFAFEDKFYASMELGHGTW